ncbi:MAG: hypothetical protein QOJ01_104 [Solirubrobacterales bacterium]|jgi:MFS family permease|nr:hypothetical protein [Solirubrobacterales bacterium]
MIPAQYRQLFAIREVRLPILGSAIGRLPLGSASLAVILLVRAKTGSFADAGIVEAALTIGVGIGLPIQGRIIDRTGQTLVLVVTQVVSAGSFAGLVVSAGQGATAAVMAAFAFGAGAFVPPLGVCMRGLWGTMLEDGPLRQSAYALDAVIIEFAFIAGPLITAGVVAVASPSAAVVVSAALEVVGTFLFAVTSASRQWRGEGVSGDWAGPLRSPGVRVLALTSLSLGFAGGALILGLTAFATLKGSKEAAGILISVQAVASLAGGLWYGARAWRAPLERRYVLTLVLLAAGFLPLAAAWSILSMAFLVVLSGFALAPSSAIEYSLADTAAPAGTSTEAFAWLITATVVGAGTGEAICGAIVNSGHVNLGLLISGAAAVIAAATAFAGRRALVASPAT